MKNVRKHKDIKLLTIESRRNYLESKPNYHKIKYFIGNLLAIEIEDLKYL